MRIVDNKVVHFFGVKSLILHLKYLDVTFDCPNDKEDVPDDKNNAQMNMNIDTIVIHTPEKNITSNTGSIRGDPDWISGKNSLELIELSSINKVSLVYVSSCSNTGSIRDDPYWISRKNSLELIELFSINIVNLV